MPLLPLTQREESKSQICLCRIAYVEFRNHPLAVQTHRTVVCEKPKRRDHIVPANGVSRKPYREIEPFIRNRVPHRMAPAPLVSGKSESPIVATNEKTGRTAFDCTAHSGIVAPAGYGTEPAEVALAAASGLARELARRIDFGICGNLDFRNANSGSTPCRRQACIVPILLFKPFAECPFGKRRIPRIALKTELAIVTARHIHANDGLCRQGLFKAAKDLLESRPHILEILLGEEARHPMLSGSIRVLRCVLVGECRSGKNAVASFEIAFKLTFVLHLPEMRCANLADENYVCIKILAQYLVDHPLHQVDVKRSILAPYLRLRICIGVFTGDDIHIEDAISRLLELLHSALVPSIGRFIRALTVTRGRKDAFTIDVQIRAVAVHTKFRNSFGTGFQLRPDLLIRDTSGGIIYLPRTIRLIEPRASPAAIVVYVLESNVFNPHPERIAAARDPKPHLHRIRRHLYVAVVVDALTLTCNAISLKHRIDCRTDVRGVKSEIAHALALCILKAHLRQKIASKAPFKLAPSVVEPHVRPRLHLGDVG